MNPPNDNNYPQSELDILEGMINHMFNGTMTMLFKTMQDPTFVEIVDPNTVFNTTDSNHKTTVTDLDGSDFKRIAQKRRQKMINDNDEDNNYQSTSSINNNNNINNNQLPQQVNDHGLHNVISIFNRDHQLENNNNIHQDIFSTLFGINNQSNSDSMIHDNNNQGSGWTFSSSSMSSKSHIHSDGTEETVTTTKRNGITETVTRIKYPDGSIEETKHVGGNGNNNNIMNSPGLITSPTSSILTTPTHFPNNDDTSSSSNPLSRFFKSIWG